MNIKYVFGVILAITNRWTEFNIDALLFNNLATNMSIVYLFRTHASDPITAHKQLFTLQG